jgi:hypothetical protein
MSKVLRFKLIFDMENAAFDPTPEREAARILRELADRVEVSGCGDMSEYVVRDVNGNRVGIASAGVDIDLGQ